MHKWVVLWLCVMVSGVWGQQLKLVSTQKLDMQPVGFRENKVQIVDQHYQPNSRVLYLCNMGNYKLQLRADGLSIEEVRLISGAERNNGKQRGIFSEASGTTTDMDTSSYYYLR